MLVIRHRSETLPKQHLQLIINNIYNLQVLVQFGTFYPYKYYVYKIYVYKN